MARTNSYSDALTLPRQGGRSASRTLARLTPFLVFYVLLVSGNPVAADFDREQVLFMSLGLFALCWLMWPRATRLSDIAIVSGFSIIAIMHVLAFGKSVLPASAGVIIGIVAAMLASRSLAGFWTYYVRILAWLSVISLVFQVPVWIGIDVPNLLSFLQYPLQGTRRVSFIVQTFVVMDEFRNSGMFWEPGAFAGYLVIGLYMYAFNPAARFGARRWMLPALILALLSTMSTTGYVAGFTVLLFWIYQYPNFRGVVTKFLHVKITTVFLLSAGFLVYYSTPFLMEKIDHHLNETLTESGQWEITRFGNLVYDYRFIVNRPLFGWSATPQTRMALDPDAEELLERQGNGLSGFTVRFGLVGMALYFAGVYFGLKRVTADSLSSIGGVVTVCILLMGEQYLSFLLFWMLVFTPTMRFVRKRPATRRLDRAKVARA